MKRPVCVWGTGALACLLIAAYLPPVVFWLPAAVLFAAGLVLSGFPRFRWWALCFVLSAVTAILLWQPVRHSQPGLQFAGSRAVVNGTVLFVNGRDPEGVTATVQADRANNTPADFRILISGIPDAVPGQRISASVLVESVADDRACYQYYADDIFVKGSYLRDFVSQGVEKGLRYRLYCLRKALCRVLLTTFDHETGGTLAAMTTGDRTTLAMPVYQRYQVAGIPHVLVVSGLHLMIFCGLGDISKSTLAIRIFHGIRGILMALFYMGLTGMQPSVMRAGVMVVFQCTGLMCGLPVDPLTDLALAGVLLSLVTPYAVCDITFQLSFCACLGVLWASEAFRRRCPAPEGNCPRRKALHGLRQQFVVACGAALFVLPVQLQYGMALRPMCVLSNLACFLLVGPVIRWGLLTAFVGLVPALYGASQIFALLAGGLTRLLNSIVAGMAAIPVGWAASGFLGLCIFAAVVSLMTLGTQLHWPAVKLMTAMACMLTVFVLGTGLYYRGSVTVTLLGNPKAPTVVVIQDRQAVVIYQDGPRVVNAVDVFLERNQVKKLQQVIHLRRSAKGECPVRGAANYSVSWDEEGKSMSLHPLPDVKVVFSSFAKGSAAAILCGKDIVWVYQGHPPKALRDAPLEYLVAGKTAPGGLSASPQVLTLSRMHPWLTRLPVSQKRWAPGQLTVRFWPKSQAEKASAP